VPSMSYCMFENTEVDLSRCVTKMMDACDIDELDLNEYEQVAFRRMYDLCKNYMGLYEQLAADFIEE